MTPPWDTPLGGAIEIHGNQGDRGTAGCIAMTNDVMDILWSYCAVGVPVTIGP
nr:L,D-transpeptidase [Clostridium sp. AM51-4]